MADSKQNVRFSICYFNTFMWANCSTFWIISKKTVFS